MTTSVWNTRGRERGKGGQNDGCHTGRRGGREGEREGERGREGSDVYETVQLFLIDGQEEEGDEGDKKTDVHHQKQYATSATFCLVVDQLGQLEKHKLGVNPPSKPYH